MKIKIVDKNDLENLYELNKLFKNDATIEDMENYINQNNNEIICIAYLENIAVGYCTGVIMKSICYKNKWLEIEALFVREEYRNKGIGKELINFMEKEASTKNILHFHINTNKEKVETVKFYENLGYKNTGEILLDKTIE